MNQTATPRQNHQTALMIQGRDRRIQKLAAHNTQLVLTMHALERCPGVDTTDQETGATFRDLIRAALKQS